MIGLREFLSNIEYPGRFIFVGRTSGGKDAFFYGITGRSPSSKARILVEGKSEGGRGTDVVRVAVTDEEVLKKGRPDLLVYPAVIFNASKTSVTIGNGIQTEDVSSQIQFNPNPLLALSMGHSEHSYEPDKPNYTPRITGVINGHGESAVGLVKRGFGDRVQKAYFATEKLPLGAGMFVSTYNGRDTDPLVSFTGEPIELRLAAYDVGSMALANQVAEALFNGKCKDRVVSVVAGVKENDRIFETCIVNREQLGPLI